MATTPNSVRLVAASRSADAFVQELTGSVSEAEQLKLLTKGFSECNPDPSDPNSRTMADVFTTLMADAQVRAALLALREPAQGGDYGVRWWTQLHFNSRAITTGGGEPEYFASGKANLADNSLVTSGHNTDAFNLKFCNYGIGRDNSPATPAWDTLSTHFNAHWGILEGFNNTRLGFASDGYYGIIGQLNLNLSWPNGNYVEGTDFIKDFVKVQLVMKRNAMYLDPHDIRVIGEHKFHRNMNAYTVPLTFYAVFEAKANDVLALELQRDAPMLDATKRSNYPDYIETITPMKVTDPYAQNALDPYNYMTIFRIA